MPQAVAYLALAAANYVQAAVFAAGASGLVATAVGNVIYAAVEVGIYVGASLVTAALTAPSVPKSGALQTPLKQSFASRRSAFGRVRIGGIYALFEAVDQDSIDVLALLDGQSQGFAAFYLGDDLVEVDVGTGGVWCPADTRKYAYGGPPGDRTFIYTRLGLPTETAYSQIGAIFPTWDADHRGDGVTSLALHCKQSKDKFQQEDFPNGVPLPSAVIDAQLVFDPRDIAQTQGDKSTYVYSDNPVLCLLAYLTDANGGMGLSYARYIAPTLAWWIAAADDCDAAEVTEAGTESRYRCAGTYLHDNAPGDVQKQLLSSFDGFLAARGDGALVVYSGRYYEPTVTFNDRNVVAYSIQHFLPDEQATNEYVVSFTDPAADFNSGEAGTVRDEDDITARGVVRSANLALDWVPSAPQAVRLGKRALSRSTQELRGTVTVNLYGMNGLGERYLRLQIEDNAALNDLVVEVSAAPKIDLAALTVTFTWIAADTAIDDGDPGGGVIIPPTPDPRPTPTPLAAPTITDLTAVYDDSGAGVAGARILIDITAPIAADVEWLARWKLSADTNWRESAYSDIADGAAVEILTGFVPATGPVDVQVAYVTAGGTSPWSATETITLAAPVAAQPYGFAFQRAIAAITVSTSAADFDTPVTWTLPAGLADCQGSIVDEGATAAAAPSADTDFDLVANGVSVGTMRFAAAALTATFIKASDTAVLLGQVVKVVAPANLNGMAGRLIGSIKGVR